MILNTPAICDSYLAQREGCYEYRAVRYRMAARKMVQLGLDDTCTVADIGAGWTELDFCLRAEFGWRGRYIPVDGGIDGTDLETWTPPRTVDFTVGLEVIEHIHDWRRLLLMMAGASTRGVLVSTPDPDKVDTFAIDPTHVAAIRADDLAGLGMTTRRVTLYGGVWSGGGTDALFAWRGTGTPSRTGQEGTRS